MISTSYISSDDMIKKLQSLKGKTKLKFYQKLSNYFDQRNIRRQSGTFHFEEDPFSKGVQGIGKLYHEVLLLMKFLQTKLHVKNLNISYYDLYYTVIKNRDDNLIVNNKFEDNEVDYIDFNDIIFPNHYDRRKNDNVIIR